MNPEQNTQQPQNAPQKPATFHFRTWWVLIPVCCGVFFMYILKNIDPVISWHKIMGVLHVHNTERYTQIFVLCILATAIVIIIKATRKK